MISGWLTYSRRQWGYGLLEVLSIGVLAFSFPVLVSDHNYALGANDPGMARMTAACLVALSIGLFDLANCVKRLDADSKKTIQ